MYMQELKPQNEITVVKRDSISPNSSPIHHNNALMCDQLLVVKALQRSTG